MIGLFMILIQDSSVSETKCLKEPRSHGYLTCTCQKWVLIWAQLSAEGQEGDCWGYLKPTSLTEHYQRSETKEMSQGITEGTQLMVCMQVKCFRDALRRLSSRALLLVLPDLCGQASAGAPVVLLCVPSQKKQPHCESSQVNSFTAQHLFYCYLSTLLHSHI